MTANTFLSLLGDFSCSGKFTSDPIDLTHHEKDHAQDKEKTMRNFLHQNSIAVYDRARETPMMLTKRNHTKQPYSSIFMSMETIQNDRHETFEGAVHEESRDDHTIPSLMDEDLVIAHPSAADHEIRDEAIEIINISFLHE